jgi:16S rRNA (cytidine1402-2'-O)-methyltransferase
MGTERAGAPRSGTGTLYVVATPIGNLEDVSLRALRVLREVDLVAAEDTRHVRKLLDHYGIRKRVVSYHEHNERTRTPQLLAALRSGRSVALVSDAGTPALSDPGYPLVRACAEAHIPVVPVPGPSAAVAALVVSGLPTDRFLFLGFPPRRRPARRRFFEEVRDGRATLVLFESPHRLADCLEDALAVLGDRRAAVCRELTKLHEEVRRGTLSELVSWARQAAPLGEVTVVVEGASREAAGARG